jgi:hypothetical protein
LTIRLTPIVDIKGSPPLWRWTYGPKPPAKRLSGGRRRALAGRLPPGRWGKPQGLTAKVKERHFYLQRALAWIGQPDWSDAKLARALRSKEISRDVPELSRLYEDQSERTLRRDIATVQCAIFGPKQRKRRK